MDSVRICSVDPSRRLYCCIARPKHVLAGHYAHPFQASIFVFAKEVNIDFDLYELHENPCQSVVFVRPSCVATLKLETGDKLFN